MDNQPSRQDSRTKIDVFRDFAYGKSLDEEESSCASKTYNIMKKISSEEAGARSTEAQLAKSKIRSPKGTYSDETTILIAYSKQGPEVTFAVDNRVS